MKKYNLLTGIILNDLVTFVFFLVNPVSLIQFGDLDFMIGGFCGLYYAFYYRKQSQGTFSVSLTVGIGGGFLSAISVGLVTYLVYYASGNLNILFGIMLSFIWVGSIIGTLIGVIGGLIVYIMKPRKTKFNDDDFKPFKLEF